MNPTEQALPVPMVAGEAAGPLVPIGEAPAAPPAQAAPERKRKRYILKADI